MLKIDAEPGRKELSFRDDGKLAEKYGKLLAEGIVVLPSAVPRGAIRFRRRPRGSTVLAE